MITGSGVTTYGHLPKEAFEALHKLLVTGGVLLFNIRDIHWEGEKKTDLGYREKIDQMINDGKFEKIE